MSDDYSTWTSKIIKHLIFKLKTVKLYYIYSKNEIALKNELIKKCLPSILHCCCYLPYLWSRQCFGPSIRKFGITLGVFLVRWWSPVWWDRRSWGCPRRFFATSFSCSTEARRLGPVEFVATGDHSRRPLSRYQAWQEHPRILLVGAVATCLTLPGSAARSQSQDQRELSPSAELCSISAPAEIRQVPRRSLRPPAADRKMNCNK